MKSFLTLAAFVVGTISGQEGSEPLATITKKLTWTLQSMEKTLDVLFTVSMEMWFPRPPPTLPGSARAISTPSIRKRT